MAPHLTIENDFFPRVFVETPYFLRAGYSGSDRSNWIVLIKSEILIVTGMDWPLSSDKWNGAL